MRTFEGYVGVRVEFNAISYGFAVRAFEVDFAFAHRAFADLIAGVMKSAESAGFDEVVIWLKASAGVLHELIPCIVGAGS